MLSPRENALIAYKCGIPEDIPCFFTDFALGQACPRLERPWPVPSGYDSFGVNWVYEESVNAGIPEPGRYLFEDICDWRDYVKFPDLDAIDWEKESAIDKKSSWLALPPGASDHIEEYVSDKVRMALCINGMFERLHEFMGFENALIAIASEPEECYEFFGAVADYKIKYYQKIAKYYDFDVLECHDDYGSQDRLFISPEAWRKLIKPHLKRIVDAVHDLGLIYQHHSCGHIEPLVEDFIELGMDAVDTWQSACNPHIAEIKKKYQDKLCFIGCMDNTNILDNLDATPEMIQAEYRKTADTIAVGGSYIMFPITATFGFIGPLLEEHFRYGKGFYADPKHRER